ncbi:translocation/assembly module TamB domain-containing protein [Roseibium salinum]|uniref:Translocation/assembly module TamB domain-containing protein n=1 Tax=Roseibium salinum TaxID=1604349 RepID=A0ABT3QVU6_9HYPH|nr:translocation/assembly module TamB domain-containing protein [Roseibium sp. DSM 29163]MCX2721041.1 translocation/assembly module TamB domain-containing protein [Roseibium sp. DSM 29163]
MVQLDVAVEAPESIFVRGRGVDARLGGSVRLTGSAASIEPVGAFNLVRGRLEVLGRRIVFDEGRVTLVGDLDPFIYFVASTEGGDVAVFINVQGRLSDVNISFSSEPRLPEDEVLARLLFGRGLAELSPAQIGRLALAAAELAGGAETPLLASLQNAIGLDNLDVITGPEGGVGVGAGRYISDNVYLGAELGAEGNTRATINLDITPNLKARGAVGADGSSEIGIFFERDY